MKKTMYIVTMIAAATLAATPVAANARPHSSHAAGAVITGLAVGLGIGMLASAQSAPAQSVVYTQPAPVVYTQPAPVVYAPPAPVVYPQPVQTVVYAPPTQTVVYRESVVYPPAPRYDNHHTYVPPRHHYNPPPRHSPPPRYGNGLRRR